MNSMYSQDWANLGRYQAANEKLGKPDKDEKRIVLMGNSITEGWEQADPDLFASTGFINRGIGGQTSPQMLMRFQADVIDLEPELVLILAGTNDIAGNTGPIGLDEISDNIIKMVELAENSDIKAIICSVLPAYDFPWSPGKKPHIKIPQLNAMLKAYANDNDIIYLDYFSTMTNDVNGLPKEYALDGVHPTKAGYDVMKKMMLKVVDSTLN